MKKSLLLTAAIASALAANAEVFDYSFRSNDNAAMPFLSAISDESSEFYYPGNYELVDKYGVAMPNTVGMPVINTPEGAEKGEVDLGVAISLYDGGVYKLSADAFVGSGEELEEMPAENYNYPFLSWGDKGMTRTIFMPGWGTEDEWADADYNSAIAADWIATKNGVQFTRLGTQGVVSRQDTYIQYPAVTGDVTVTVWAGTNLGGTANPDNLLKVIVTPVFDGVADPEQAVEITKEDPANKRYYKLDPIKFDANGKSLAVRVGCNGAQLNLMYVRIEGEKAAGIADVIATETIETPAYNLLGVQVDNSYKGIVVKNGKKYVQK